MNFILSIIICFGGSYIGHEILSNTSEVFICGGITGILSMSALEIGRR